MVCYNPLLAEERKRKREELLAATEKALSRIGKEVERRTRKPLTATEIALKVGKVLGHYKALFRGWGILCTGTEVYAPCHREEWLNKNSQAGVRRRGARQ